MSPTSEKKPKKVSVKRSATVEKKPVSVKRRLKVKDEISAPAESQQALTPAASTFGDDERTYLRAIGRRKEAVAQIRLYKNGTGKISVNQRPVDAYFPSFEYRLIAVAPLLTVGQSDKVDVSALVSGGGLRGQADSVSLGIARALLELNPTFRRSLRKAGLITRDARIKERKKPGLKRARRAPQWQKR